MDARVLFAIIVGVSVVCLGVAAFAGAAPSDQPAFEACNRFASETWGASRESAQIAPGSQQSPALRRPAGQLPKAAESGSEANAGASSQTTTSSPLGRSTSEPSDVGTTASDPSLKGMAAAGQGDPAYQRAYRECMQGKLWSGT